MHEVISHLESLPGQVVHGEAVKARAHMARSEHRLAACLLVIERTSYYQQMGFGTIVQYADEQLKLDGGKAMELLRSARLLERLPLLAEAFRTAQLGWGKIRELTRVVAPETEQQWLEFALANSTDQLRQQVSQTPRDWKRRAQAAGAPELPFDAAPGPSEKAVVPQPSAQGSPVDSNEAAPLAGDADLFSTGGALHAERALPAAGANSALSSEADATTASPGRGKTTAGREGKPPGETRSPGATGPGWEGAPVGPGYASVHAPTEPLPLPLPGPKYVRVTLHFKPDEYAIYEQAQKRVSSLRGKRVAREEATVEMARQTLAAAPERSRVRHQVVIHVDAATEQAWVQTERGILVLPAEQRDQALADGQIQFELEQPSETRTEGEQSNRGKSTDRTQSEQTNRGKSTARTQAEQTNRGKSAARTQTERSNRGKSAGQAETEQSNRGNPGNRPDLEKLSPRVPLPTLRALFARAGGRCEVPGCGATYCLQVHHKKPRSERGTHELRNLELRCAGCHRVGHANDFEEKPKWRKARNRKRKPG